MSGAINQMQSPTEDSQLLQLSQIAALQDKMVDVDPASSASRKRTADGQVKDSDERSSTSPVRAAHSRNTSTVSMASTAGSRIGELSAELRTRLSYAMVKVNHGWQSHSIDEVESLASQAVSPTSSSSTLHRRKESSMSPALSQSSRPMNNLTPPASQTQPTSDPWKQESSISSRDSADRGPGPDAATPKLAPITGLAPPATIQPSSALPQQNGRRNSRPNYTPTMLSHSQTASPRTPLPSAVAPTSYSQPNLSTPVADPILFSRDQDAIEALIFMSSPGNSANLKHVFSPAASPSTSSLRTPGMRHALPSSQPRKHLPSHGPLAAKRAGFEKSSSFTSPLSDGDVEMGSPKLASPRSIRPAPRRRGATLTGTPRVSWILPASMGGLSTRPKPPLGDEEIERMLERVAAAESESSDDEAEIEIPARRGHPAVMMGS